MPEILQFIYFRNWSRRSYCNFDWVNRRLWLGEAAARQLPVVRHFVSLINHRLSLSLHSYPSLASFRSPGASLLILMSLFVSSSSVQSVWTCLSSDWQWCLFQVSSVLLKNKLSHKFHKRRKCSEVFTVTTLCCRVQWMGIMQWVLNCIEILSVRCEVLSQVIPVSNL